MSDNKLFDAFLALSVAKIIVDKDQPVGEPQPWPFNYGQLLFFRAGWSIVTVYYVNFCIENVTGLGSGYFSIWWAFALAWIPIIGSCVTPISCIILILLGVPSSDPHEISNRFPGVDRCYVEQC